MLFGLKWISVSLDHSERVFLFANRVCASGRHDDACPGCTHRGWLRPIFGERHVLFIIRHFVIYSVAGLDRDID